MTPPAQVAACAPCEERGSPPGNCLELYISFTLMALQAFGGSTAIAQQFLVEQKKWLKPSEFLELLTISQVLPGPNIMILMLMVGDRYLGWRGALAAFLGMVSVPALLMISVFVFYQQYSENPTVSNALVGMAASACGMVAGAALKLVGNCTTNVIGPAAWILGLAATFVTVGVMKISMVYILPGLGIPLSVWAWYCFSRIPKSKDPAS